MVGTGRPDQSVISPRNSFWGKWNNSGRLSGNPGSVQRSNRARFVFATFTDSTTYWPIAPFPFAHKRAKGCSGFCLLRQLAVYHGCRLPPSLFCILPCSSLNLFMKREHNSTLSAPWIPIRWGQLFYRPIRQTIAREKLGTIRPFS